MAKRITLTLNDKELITDLTTLKRQEFYDKSYAELYRYVMEQGIAALKAKKKKGTK